MKTVEQVTKLGVYSSPWSLSHLHKLRVGPGERFWSSQVPARTYSHFFPQWALSRLTNSHQNLPIPCHGEEKVILIPYPELLARRKSIFSLPGSCKREKSLIEPCYFVVNSVTLWLRGHGFDSRFHQLLLFRSSGSSLCNTNIKYNKYELNVLSLPARSPVKGCNKMVMLHFIEKVDITDWGDFSTM